MSEQSPRGAPGIADTLSRRALEEGTRLASPWLVSDAERLRRARLARWQQGAGNERDEQQRRRQTAPTRAQEAPSARTTADGSAA